MSSDAFSHQQLLQDARFSPEDIAKISQRRRSHNRLGFAYQLAFARLTNRFPKQEPLEIIDKLLIYVGVQLDIAVDLIHAYQKHRQTLSDHRIELLDYLGLRRCGPAESETLEKFIFEQACRLEQTGPLLFQSKQFLKNAGILCPADDTLQRLLSKQRELAKQYIFKRLLGKLSRKHLKKLDGLLISEGSRMTRFHWLKAPPGKPSPKALLRLADKLSRVQETGILTLDISWLNNNYQRVLTRYAQRTSADRLRDLQPERRYSVLICFLWQTYRDTLDHMMDMYHKLMMGVNKRAQTELDEHTRKQRQAIQASLGTFHTLGEVILDEAIPDSELRAELFNKVARNQLTDHLAAVETWLTGKYSHVFHLVLQRLSYLRQFAPALLESLDFQLEEGIQSSVVEAVQFLRKMNQTKKRTLSGEVPLDFISKPLRSMVENNGQISKRVWECALLITLRDEIRAGNVFIRQSKRFRRFDNFFISDRQWQNQREGFFQRARLPVNARDVPDFLARRLDKAYARFLEQLPKNTYAQVDEDGWHLSADRTDKLDADGKQGLDELEGWLSRHLRRIKLPELLIEVDNELRFTLPFMPISQQRVREAGQVCTILATLIAHGCNIGPYTMAQLTSDISYGQIKQVTDWQLTEDAQRQALAKLVNAIGSLEISQAWGSGTTSSSDGQRFRLRRKVLQQTYSPRFHDYAIEFYSFVADNYAPFYSTVIECTDRDAAYVLDGLLYNESDLALEEHYTDTHGYTEINFAAFAMLGRRFAPRIRGLKKQLIYRIGKEKDYAVLSPLIDRPGGTVGSVSNGTVWDNSMLPWKMDIQLLQLRCTLYNRTMSTPRSAGQHAGLTHEQVLEEARTIADQDGIDGLTMRALAKCLGVMLNALYTYFPNKQALLDALLDSLLGDIDVVGIEELDWRSGLTRIMDESRRLLLSHPQLIPMFLSRPGLGINATWLGKPRSHSLERRGSRDNGR